MNEGVVMETIFGTTADPWYMITFENCVSWHILVSPWSKERVDKPNTCYSAHSWLQTEGVKFRRNHYQNTMILLGLITQS